MTSKKLTLLLPEEWIAAFRREAAKRDLSLGAWLGECALDHLPQSVRAKLPERRERGRPVEK